MSKGSTPRPYSVPKATFDQAFDRIFGKCKECGTKCKECGKQLGGKDDLHTCSPQIQQKDERHVSD